jgi:predicted GIY-YIG superfamily endonuclease
MLNLMRRGSAILGTIPLRHQPLRNASQKEVKVAVNGAVRIFYRLVCLDKSVTDSYVGMTANVQRAINRHKRKSIIKYSYNRKIYETIRNNGNWNNWRVEILEVKIFKTIVDAYIRKQYWVTELKPIMNSMNVPYKGRKFISSPFYESSKSSFTFKHSGVVVYQLKCKDESVKDTFIGATTNLSNVLRSHRGKYESKTYNDRRLYQIIRDTGGWAKWEVCILEDSNFDSAHQINDMKAFWCDKLKPTLNGRYRAAFV